MRLPLALLPDGWIDLSICPTNVGNVRMTSVMFEVVYRCFFLLVQNTYSTALLIGEKAAVIIAQDLNLPLD
jgi:hypothetical protein